MKFAIKNVNIIQLGGKEIIRGGGGGKRRGLGPRNDALTTCKAVSQRPSKAAVCFLTISTLALSFE